MTSYKAYLCMDLMLCTRDGYAGLSPQAALSIFGVYWSVRCFIQPPQLVDLRFVLELPDQSALSKVRAISKAIQFGESPPSGEVNGELGTTCKLLALMGCWVHVREFVAALRIAEDPVSMLTSFTEMDIQTTACFNSFDNARHASPESSPASLDKFIVADILYHQCRAIPHLYMFLLNQDTYATQHEFVQLSGSMGFRHLLLLTESIHRLLQLHGSGQGTSAPPFVGYPAFLAASLQLGSLVYLREQQQQQPLFEVGRLTETLRTCVCTSLNLLNRLRFFWAPLQVMVSQPASFSSLPAFLLLTPTQWNQLLPLIARASIPIPDAEPVAGTAKPLVSDPIAKELQSFATRHLSEIMLTINIREPFYLPLETEGPEQDILLSIIYPPLPRPDLLIITSQRMSPRRSAMTTTSSCPNCMTS
ncbi:predicted protein [Aspergillus terreus NIH2624]|uniref:Transcription factor domain-containing protein n=1 Tax=Aspergillus terreus (strain NIH 2624 / FGSC A1156) TaxID=341663 RepID=Q0C8S7_ASPTN|nr:uncharacterized protein ATEG_09907 [Aspergillus terreus NIH2624]EAU30098.1 predicted protein [Aspergillus terreus NIH2624]